MIDTVKLMLSEDMFRVTSVSRFQKQKQNAARGYFILVQNATKSELLEGIYKPKLTLTKRFNTSGIFGPTLSIELSLPKLLYRNNFDECEDKEFDQIIDLLQQVLKRMGVDVSKDILISAPVVAVHYSKNIPLTDGTIPFQYIKKISQGNYKLSLDTDKVNYRNNGQLFKIHTNSWEHVVYDKIKEIQIARQSDKRSIETDNVIQLNIFVERTMCKPFEVLRLEARYNTREKIRHVLKTIGIDAQPILKDLFSSKIAQKVMFNFLNQLEKARPLFLDDKPQKNMELLPTIVTNNPNFPPGKLFMFYGLKLAMDRYDIRELKRMFSKNKYRSWQRLINESQEINLSKTQDTFGTLRKHLTEFQPLKLVNYEV